MAASKMAASKMAASKMVATNIVPVVLTEWDGPNSLLLINRL